MRDLAPTPAALPSTPSASPRSWAGQNGDPEDLRIGVDPVDPVGVDPVASPDCVPRRSLGVERWWILGLATMTLALPSTISTARSTSGSPPSPSSEPPSAAAPTETHTTEMHTTETPPPIRLVDRLLAWVDEDPIFLSDVRRALDLGLIESEEETVEDDHPVPTASPSSPTDGHTADREGRALDRLIDERLRLHEVERYESEPISSVLVDRQIAAMETRAGGFRAFDRDLAALGIGRDEVRGLVRRQLRILAYVEERLGARIFIDEEALRDHYSGPLARELTDRGEPLPPFPEVRDAIHALLFQIELNREIDAWTEELHRSADIVDLRDHRLEGPVTWPRPVLRLERREPEPRDARAAAPDDGTADEPGDTPIDEGSGSP